MSADAVQPGVTGRKRRGGEAAPSQVQPEDEAAVGEGEAEAGVAEGVYFSKVPSRDVWHAYDKDDNPIGRVYKGTDGRWHVKIGRDDAPVSTGSATGGKMYLAGYFYGCQQRHGGAIEGAREPAAGNALTDARISALGTGPGHLATGSVPTGTGTAETDPDAPTKDHGTNAVGDAQV